VKELKGHAGIRTTEIRTLVMEKDILTVSMKRHHKPTSYQLMEIVDTRPDFRKEKHIGKQVKTEVAGRGAIRPLPFPKG
jgi:hypothetical protein